MYVTNIYVFQKLYNGYYTAVLVIEIKFYPLVRGDNQILLRAF